MPTPSVSAATHSPFEKIRCTTAFGSPGSNRSRTGARNSSMILSRPFVIPAPGIVWAVASQLASSWNSGRSASRSPLLSVSKNSRTRNSLRLSLVAVFILILVAPGSDGPGRSITVDVGLQKAEPVRYTTTARARGEDRQRLARGPAAPHDGRGGGKQQKQRRRAARRAWGAPGEGGARPLL